MKKYIAIDHKNSKYYKDIPYISKKEFKDKNDNVVVGKTRLKKWKSNSNKDVALLNFGDKDYEVKEKLWGFKKGYVDVGNNMFILLKKRIPFLFLLFLFLLLLLFLLCMLRPKKDILDNPTIPTPIQEEVKTPDNIPNNNSKDDSKLVEKDKDMPISNNTKPIVSNDEVFTYTIEFDANGGNGKMDSIICEENKSCKLPNGIFEREGYSFVGWSTNSNDTPIYKDGVDVSNLSDKAKENIILYAIWEINTFEITFLDYDDSIISKNKYDYGQEIVEPQIPKRNGYQFNGWDKESKIVKEDIVIKATYIINTYNIFYELNGGILEDAPQNYTVEHDSLTIANPQKLGYNFVGWTVDKDEEPIKDYEIPKGSTGNIELIANYEPNIYNLIFNTNGAKENISPKMVKYNSNFGELPKVTKNGYTFVNWADNENKEVSSDTIFKEANDITLSANWQFVSYDIIYNLVGGSIENNPLSYNIESDSITVPNPIKEGYIFLGWSTDESDNFVKDYEIPKGSTGNVELTANYKPISYYISYHSQDAKGIMEDTKVKYNTKAKLRKNSFEKEGYVFKGWSTEIDGDVIYTDESEIYNLASKDTAVIDLYAKWEIIQLKIKYVDLFGVILKEEKIDYGSNPNYPEDPFIDGYTFTRWNCTSNIIKDDTTCKAEYEIENYVINYDLNKGEKDDVKTIRYNVETESITLPNPKREGYEFLGWTGSNGLNPQKTITHTRGTTGNKSYKANWTANIYNVKLNPNKGTVNPTDINVSYDSVYGIIPEPSRLGYSFEGWYSGNDKISDSTVMKKNYNHELTADWQVIDYDIVYNLNGGTLNSPISKYNIESEQIIIPTPTKKGYEFLGWTGSNGTIPQKNVVISKGSIGNKNYEANWQVINYTINYNLDGGNMSSSLTSYNIETPAFTLPIPTKEGYSFQGWTGTDLSSASKTVTINKSIGNRNYTATWSKNYYNVNYYINGNLWTTRSVGYNDALENLDGQSALDGYHTFHGWNGWVDRMPSHAVTLNANVTEAYCNLITGHGPYGNASGLLSVFQSAGWTGNIIEAPNFPGNYLVITDYNLTRYQAEVQKNYIAAHTNYTNYSFPYLYWVGVSCTNGYGESWTRSLGQINFN